MDQVDSDLLNAGEGPLNVGSGLLDAVGDGSLKAAVDRCEIVLDLSTSNLETILQQNGRCVSMWMMLGNEGASEIRRALTQ
jgi:hypothetical protein